MPHDVSLIALLAAGFGLARVFGYLASLLRMPPLVGYLLAGIVLSLINNSEPTRLSHASRMPSCA